METTLSIQKYCDNDFIYLNYQRFLVIAGYIYVTQRLLRCCFVMQCFFKDMTGKRTILETARKLLVIIYYTSITEFAKMGNITIDKHTTGDILTNQTGNSLLILPFKTFNNIAILTIDFRTQMSICQGPGYSLVNRFEQ